MGNENELERKIRLNCFIDEFKNSGIVTSDGKVDLYKYNNWFVKFIKNAKTKSITSTMDTIDDANFITKIACDDLNTKFDESLLDGGMKDDELARFILSITPEKEVVKEIKQIIDKLEKNENHEDDNKQDNQSNEVLLNNDEQLIKVFVLLKPLFILSKDKDENPLIKEEKIQKLQAQFINVLKNKGFSQKQIDDATKIVKENKIECEKEKKTKEQYNFYNDWRYIYYMSTLGYGYSIHYDEILGLSKTSSRIIVKPLYLEVSNTQINKEQTKFVYSDGKKETMTRELEQDFYLEFIAFKGKYQLEIDSNELICDLKYITSEVAYNQLYKDKLKEYYELIEDKNIDSSVFIEQYNKMMNSLSSYLGLNFAKNYGGMDGNQMYEFCIDLCDKRFNLSAKIEREIFQSHGRIDEINSNELTNILERRFAQAYNSAIIEDQEDDSKREALACYLLLDKTHKMRNRWFRFAHPINYSKEDRVLRHMKDTIDNEFVNEENLDEVNEMIENKTVYRQGFNEERSRLRTFSIRLTRTDSLFDDLNVRLDVDIDENKEIESISPEGPNSTKKLENINELDELLIDQGQENN